MDKPALDPRLRLPELPKEQLLFAVHGGVAHFKDECFVLSDGVKALPHPNVASALATEMAIWAYKAVRTRQIYWLDKQLFIKRIFRSTNLCIWQKRREPGFEDGLATSMVVAIIGPKGIWIGSVGNSSAWVFHQGHLLRLTREDVNERGILTRALGFQRLGLWPNSSHQNFFSDDMLLLLNQHIREAISLPELTKLLRTPSDSQQDIDRLTAIIAEKASEPHLAIIKRVSCPQ